MSDPIRFRVKKGAGLAGLCAIVLACLAGAAGASPAITATVLPCSEACGVMQWGRLDVDRPGVGQTIVPTSMQSVDEVHANRVGNFVVVGHMANGMGVISVIRPASNRPIAEFWTAHWGLSPGYRYIAFTEMVATHGEGADYSDKMVYVYDTESGSPPPQWWVRRPEEAVPVFPESLVKEGRLHVLRVSHQRLASVISDNFKWLAPDSFEFVATDPSAPDADRRYVPTVVTAGDQSDWQHATRTNGVPGYGCDLSRLDVDDIMASCRR